MHVTIFFRKNEPGTISVTNRLLLSAFFMMAFFSLSHSVLAADKPLSPSQDKGKPGVYCLSDQDEMRVLAVSAPDKKDNLKFGVSLWFPNGNNFALYATAKKQGDHWSYEENLKSSRREERCGVNISLLPDGSYKLQTYQNAKCLSYGGYNAVLEEAVFPQNSYESPVKTELDNFENLMNAGKCSKGPNPRFK